MLHSQRAPLYEALVSYHLRQNATFHVPGHKNGQAYDAGPASERCDEEIGLLREVMKIDVTEISGTDDLHQPEGVIREAQELAAACFGAEETHFLVGGSTVGNLALILTCCTEPGDLLIVQRNVHKSVLHGLMLAGARAVFVAPRLDPRSGLATAPAPEAVRRALERYPAAKGVLLCSPNYYGMGIDLRPLAQLAHEHGKPLLVDEAHGAHYGLHPALPDSALQCGADGVVQSTHKMLSALTMGAMLHVQGPRLDRALLKQRLTMLQSSSPSYPLMASLDVSRRFVHSRGPLAFERGLEAALEFRRRMERLPQFALLGPAQSDAYASLDPFKAVVSDRTGAYSGYELQALLEDRGCVPEMSDARHVVLAFGLGSTPEDTDRLFAAFRDIAETIGREAGSRITNGPAPDELRREEPPATPRPAAGTGVSDPVPFGMRPYREDEIEAVPLAAAAGRIAAEMAIPYPPGIPLVYPGELIAEQTQAALATVMERGAKCQGVQDPTLRTIRVFKL
ncbi:Arginine decarboxylase [Paenibacillus sp. CECT 9249]|uniref:aminotransferase class I/II-fold pyridoxal phosphate-dependent enzyme n=1 Tax=Paenibacillus sp. CECT 9249 TaxID=2845385 RepID=UPI001E48041D|nr:aminotransferase class I/II-fold pyridoxal phosphate-dependent enzyme [Paenibacillus sp. CECT 9249]CAH0122701.1 Arginine decarboxylase [Paenibacillus sp. CECT 9249]